MFAGIVTALAEVLPVATDEELYHSIDAISGRLTLTLAYKDRLYWAPGCAGISPVLP